MKFNHAAVWIMVFLDLIITVIWRSPLMFYTIWIEEQGRKLESAPQEDNMPFVTAVISFIILNYFISWLTHELNRDTLRKGLTTGVILSLGFALPVIAMNYKALDVSNLVLLIDLGLTMLLVMLSSILLSTWRKNS